MWDIAARTAHKEIWMFVGNGIYHEGNLTILVILVLLYLVRF